MFFHSTQWSCLLPWKCLFLQPFPFFVKQMRRRSSFPSPHSSCTYFLAHCVRVSGHPRKHPKENVEEQGIEFLRPSVTRGNSIPKAGCQLTPRNRLLSIIVALEYPLSTNATSLKLGFQAGKCSHSIGGPLRDCEAPLLYLWLLFLLSNCMIRLIWKVTCSSQGTIFLVEEGILTLPTGLCLCREVL